MRRTLDRLIGLLAVLTGVGIPTLRWARGEVPVPGEGAAVVLALLVAAGLVLLLVRREA